MPVAVQCVVSRGDFAWPRCEAGRAFAQAYFAFIRERGRGADQDYAEAYRWLSLAASPGPRESVALAISWPRTGLRCKWRKRGAPWEGLRIAVTV